MEKHRIAYDNERSLTDLTLSQHFIRVRVDRLTTSCLGLHCSSPVPPGRPLSTIRDGTPQSPSVSERRRDARVHRADAILSTTSRRMPMRMRRTIPLSL